MRNKLETYILLGLISFITLSCGGGDDDPPVPPPPPVNLAPTKVQTLIYPTADLLCIDNVIGFDWSNATDPENDPIKYRITIATNRGLSQIVKQQLVSNSNIIFTLEKGVAFYWNIIAIDNNNNESAATMTQAFYTSGTGNTNYAPFTAVIIGPEMGSNINAGTISLVWEGSDTDTDDVLTYDLFFGESNNPSLLQADIANESFDVNTIAGKTYYWKVNTIDNSGAKSIGQVWEFTTN